MPDCPAFFVECLAGALSGIGVIGLCWRLRRPIKWAQHYDPHIDKDGMFRALPIYGYLRRYFLVLLLAGCIVFLVSTVPAVPVILAVLDSPSARCPDDGFSSLVLKVLVIFLSVHMPTIAAFERTKRRHQGPYPVTELVENVRKRLWGVAVFLLLAVGSVALASAL